MDYSAENTARMADAKGVYMGGAGHVGHTGLGYGQIAGDMGNVKVEQSPFLTVASTLAQSVDLCSRIEALADRLLGPEPREATGQGVPPDSPFILRAVEQSAYQTTNRLHSAMRAMDRIERALP
jgi:hypothetical protein